MSDSTHHNGKEVNGKQVETDERVYQKDGGKLYIDTNEFVQSEEGQELIDYFRKHTEEVPEEEE